MGKLVHQEPDHSHDTPSRAEAAEQDIGPGSVWECGECGERLRWTYMGRWLPLGSLEKGEENARE